MELTQFKSKCSINQLLAPEFIVALSIGNKSILNVDLLVCCPKFWKYIDLNAKATNSPEEIRSNLTDRPILGERLSSSWRRPPCLRGRGLRAILLWSELWKRGLGKRLPPSSILLHGTYLACTSHGTLCVARIMPRLPPRTTQSNAPAIQLSMQYFNAYCSCTA